MSSRGSTNVDLEVASIRRGGIAAPPPVSNPFAILGEEEEATTVKPERRPKEKKEKKERPGAGSPPQGRAELPPSPPARVAPRPQHHARPPPHRGHHATKTPPSPPGPQAQKPCSAAAPGAGGDSPLQRRREPLKEEFVGTGPLDPPRPIYYKAPVDLEEKFKVNLEKRDMPDENIVRYGRIQPHAPAHGRQYDRRSGALFADSLKRSGGGKNNWGTYQDDLVRAEDELTTPTGERAKQPVLDAATASPEAPEVLASRPPEAIAPRPPTAFGRKGPKLLGQYLSELSDSRERSAGVSAAFAELKVRTVDSSMFEGLQQLGGPKPEEAAIGAAYELKTPSQSGAGAPVSCTFPTAPDSPEKEEEEQGGGGGGAWLQAQRGGGGSTKSMSEGESERCSGTPVGRRRGVQRSGNKIYLQPAFTIKGPVTASSSSGAAAGAGGPP